MTLLAFQQLMQDLIRDTDFANKSYLVGGVLRDHLLGRDDFSDFDLCIEKRHGGIKLANFLKKRVNVQSYEHFPRFGAVRMSFEGITVDLVQSRQDTYTPGSRFPHIRYATLAEDVWRRDFTVNCLYLKLFSDRILDPCTQGLQDLQNKVIRTPRDPRIVFAEDSLRLLRAIRFAATLDFELEANTKAAIIALAKTVSHLSSKAQTAELLKMQPFWPQAKLLLKETGLIDQLSPMPDFK
ncbi:MAG: hypothetical protein PWP64_1323 [Candidatus Cloacimonadota bacterium]|nr:hypothetical protein [Candidatus Cloacimonadota bacterium]